MAGNQSLVIITMFKDLDECDNLFVLLWLFGYGGCVLKPKLHCDYIALVCCLDVILSINCHALFC